MDINKIKKITHLIVNPKLIIHSKKKAMQMCLQPYYKHPNGCPNFGIKDCCPPDVDEIDSASYIVLIEFDFKDYIKQRKKQHPEWSNRMLMNQRYWQGHLRARLERVVKNMGLWDKFIDNGEAMGVNFQATCSKMDFDLEWAKSDKKGNIIEFPNKIYQIGIIR